jgi:hypothetical protein
VGSEGRKEMKEGSEGRKERRIEPPQTKSKCNTFFRAKC